METILLILFGIVILPVLFSILVYTGAITLAPLWSFLAIKTNDKQSKKLFSAIIFAFAMISILVFILTS